MGNKVIFITGSNGEMGQCLIESFNKEGFDNIVALDLEKKKNGLNANFIKGSILDRELLNDINEKYEISEIYHLAAILSTKAEKNPLLANDVNINGSKNIFKLGEQQAIKQHKDIPFFFPSSIAVYGVENQKNKIYQENESQNPITIYGANKLYAEKLGLYYSQHYNQLSNNQNFIDFRSLRFPGLISASTIPSGGTSDFIPEMWHEIKKQNYYECFVNEESRLPFLAMPDAISAIEKLMQYEQELPSRIYNVTSFNPSAKEFFNFIKNKNKNAKISYNVNPIRQKIVDSWPSDINDNLAKKEWGWAPHYDLEKTMNEYLQY